jgi:hypothetical protein
MNLRAALTDTDSPLAGRGQVCNEALAFGTDKEGFELGVNLVGYLRLRWGVKGSASCGWAYWPSCLS